VRDDMAGRWSPDGQWVAFVSNRGGQQDLWVVAAAGGNATRLTNDHAVEYNPQWSRDGRAVAFGVANARSSVMILPIDGSPSRMLVNWDGTGVGQILPAPDGSTVLFTGDRGGNGDIVVVPVAGGEPVILAGGPSVEQTAAWSPDGSQVAFASNRAGTPDLWVVSATGGEPRRLTDWSPSSEIDPKWSPDGSQIAFFSNRDAGTMELWAVPADGGEGKRLAPGFRIEGFVWSHDGQTLFVDGVLAGQGRGLYAVPSSGGTPRPLLSEDTDVSTPTLSPDGSMLGYIRFSAGWGFLEVVPVEGGTPRRLTTRTDQVYHSRPRWAPDGASIVVEDFILATSGQQFEVVSWPSGEWRQLPATPDRFMLGPEWMPDGRGVVYSEIDGGRRIAVVPVPR
jgi:Tol biopolymer transport system component